MPGKQPGLEAHQRTDRQKTLHPRWPGIIPRMSLGFKMAYEQAELYAEEETPAEEKPLDHYPPVTCFFPIDSFISSPESRS